MGLPKTQTIFTADEYLARERAAEQRHEWVDGQIRAMAGESGNHADVSANILIHLGSQLIGTPCRARTKDTKVRSGPAPRSKGKFKGLFSYPDIVVICGEPEYLDARQDVVLNPTALVEVLSPTTEAFDRGNKFGRYQGNASLKDYVLVSQEMPVIEVFSRQDDGNWSYRRFAELDDVAVVPSIGVRLALKDVYDRVEFPPEKDDDAEEAAPAT